MFWPLRLLIPKKTTAHRKRDLILGTTDQYGVVRSVIWPEAARPTHLGIIGLSGTGKTTFLESLIRQDIAQRTGFVLFDAHGDLSDRLVSCIAEHVRHHPEDAWRAVLVEPSDSHYSVIFNPLELAQGSSIHRQAQEMANILRARWHTNNFGPRTEELLRNSLLTLVEARLTLLELPSLLTDAHFRAACTSKIRDRSLLEFWTLRYDALSNPMKAVVREPLLTRVSAFLADPRIRQILGPERSSFSFRQSIQKGLWVILNLSKGKLGEHSATLGSLFFTKLEFDVLAQATVPEGERPLFTLYADELQNFVGESLGTLIAEARKYNVSVVAGHQFWDQLPPDLQGAMLAVGSRVFFRLHAKDAQQFAPEIDPREKQWAMSLLASLDRGHAVFRPPVGDAMTFKVPHQREPKCTSDDIARLRAEVRSRYARPRTAIQEEIDGRRKRTLPPKLAELLNRGS